MANFEAFRWSFSSSINLFFSEEWNVDDQDFNLLDAVEVFSNKKPNAKLGRPPKIHQCKLCHKIVKSRQQLIIHVQIVHGAKKDKRCHICDKGM